MQLVGAGFAGSPGLPAPLPHPGISSGGQTQLHPSQNFFSTNCLNPDCPCNPCKVQFLSRNTCLVPWLEPGGVPEMGFPLSYEPRLFLLHTYNLQASTLGDGAIVRGVTSGTAKRAHGGEASLHQAPQCGGVPFLFFHISFLEGLGSQSSGDSPHGSARGRGRFSAAGSPAVPGGVGVSGGAPQLPNRVLGSRRDPGQSLPAPALAAARCPPSCALSRDARVCR